VLCCSKGALHTHVEDLVGDSHFTCLLLHSRDSFHFAVCAYIQVHAGIRQSYADGWGFVAQYKMCVYNL
jgi:hypothetical protein